MAESPSVRPDPADAAFTKAAWRLIPFLFLLYLLNYLDRVNLGFVKDQLAKALDFDKAKIGAIYGFGAGIFYVGYALFEVPSNLLMEKVGARRWIARIMISWGVVSVGFMTLAYGVLRNEYGFYGMRFLLGLAEAGFFPGVILYLTYWFPAPRRAKASALFMTSIPVATALGSLISGGILDAFAVPDGQPLIWHLADWQWLFLIEGAPSIIVGILVLKLLADGPHDATWLTDAERRHIDAVLAAERASTPTARHMTFVESLGQPRLWLLVVLYFLLITGFYGINYWLPPIVKTLPFLVGQTKTTIGMVAAVPYVVCAVVMVLVARSSDRRRERRWHTAISGLVACAAMLVAAQKSGDQYVVLGCLIVTCCGMFAALSPFWSLATEYLRGSSAAGGIALINGLGCLGGFAGPYLIGWLGDLQRNSQVLPGYNLGYLAMAVSFLLFGIAVLLVRSRPAAEPPAVVAAVPAAD